MQNNDIYDMDQKRYFSDSSMSAPSPCSSQSSISSGYSSNSGATVMNFSTQYDLQGDINMTNYITTVPMQNLNCSHFNSYGNVLTTTAGGDSGNNYTSHLVILEQPTEKFRFRYKSEMHGTHGSLNGEHSEKNKKTFPEVELRGFNGNGIIRCSLYQTTVDRPSPHSHLLVVRKDDMDECDPHDLNVSPEKGYIARFENMGIIHTAKKNICDALYAKKKQKMIFETGCKELSLKQEKSLREESEREGKLMNLNQVRLCFEAFEILNGGEWRRICEPVYSRPINNRKSALTGELKICRLSSVVGSAAGGEDLILLVEKVSKKNIQVRFYELRDDDQVWEAFGDFSDADVHHQYAIVVRTPPYKNKDIDSNVNVFIELVRKSDDERSAPVSFRYKPRDIILTRKRRRTTSYASSSSSPLSSSELPESIAKGILHDPMSQQHMQQPMNHQAHYQAQTISQEFNKDAQINSFFGDQLNFFMEKVGNDSDELKKLTDNVCENDIYSLLGDIQTDGVAQVNPSVKQKQRSSAPATNIKSDGANHQIVKQIKGILCESADMTQNSMKIKKILDDYSADNGDTIIHEIIKLGQYRDAIPLFTILEKLQLTEILSQTNNLSQTPLHYACIFNQHMFIRPLLRLNCNPNVQDNKGNTALHVAANESCAECLLQFVQCMAANANIRFDANLANDDGFTPLHLAIRQNNVNYVRTLLFKFNASAKTAISRDGNNALHLAVQHHNSEIVKLILENSKVELNARNRSGHTAIDLAKTLDEKVRKDILDLLMAKLPPAIEDECNPMSIESIKDEPEDDCSTEDEDDKSLSSVEDSIDESYIKRLLENQEILDKLAEILTNGDKWKKLSAELNLNHLLCLWLNAKAMLKYIVSAKVDPMKVLSALQNVDADAARILMQRTSPKT